MALLSQSKRSFVRPTRFRRSSLANSLGDIGDLLPDEQSELALKIKYGIISFGEVLHEAARRRLVRVTEIPPEPDAGSRARIAAMGLSAGRRGQWLRR